MDLARLTALRAALGQELGPEDWYVLDQGAVITFADLSGDNQRLRIDPERAATGPFGTTEVDGLLTRCENDAGRSRPTGWSMDDPGAAVD